MANLSNINNKFIVASDGKVGIGTTVLNAISGTNPTLTLGGTGISGGLILQKAGTDTARLYENAGNMVHQGMTGIGHNFYVNAATQAMVIDTSGKVGIGTDSPSQKLHLREAGATAIFLQWGNNSDTKNSYAGLTVGGTFALQTNDEMAFYTGASFTERMRITSGGNVNIATPITNAFYGLSLQYNATDTADFKVNQATGEIKIGGVSAGYFPTFYSAGTERMRIDTSGNVGIGVTSGIDANLRVDANSATLTQEILKVKGGGSGGAYGFLVEANNGDDLFKVNTLSYDSYFPNGKVGIGTTSPNRKLTVQNGSYTYPSTGIDTNSFFAIANNSWAGMNILSSNGTGGFIDFGDTDYGHRGRILYGHATDYMVFDTAGSEKMRIDTSGNVSVGTDTPLYLYSEQDIAQIAVNRVPSSGSITDSNRSAAYINLYALNGGSLLTFHTANANNTAPTERMRIDSSGDLNIVNTGQASLNFTTDGSLDYGRITGGKSGSGVGDLRFFTYSGGIAERMRIDSNGNVILNQATSRIYGGGTATGRFFLGNSDSKSYMMINGSAHTNPNLIYFVNDAAVTMRIEPDGGIFFPSLGGFSVSNSDVRYKAECVTNA